MSYKTKNGEIVRTLTVVFFLTMAIGCGSEVHSTRSADVSAESDDTLDALAIKDDGSQKFHFWQFGLAKDGQSEADPDNIVAGQTYAVKYGFNVDMDAPQALAIALFLDGKKVSSSNFDAQQTITNLNWQPKKSGDQTLKLCVSTAHGLQCSYDLLVDIINP